MTLSQKTMVLKADQLRVKALLAETITLLCKNGLHFKTKFSIEGLIGITLDDEDIFLVSINETIRAADSVHDDSEESNASEQLTLVAKRARSKNDGFGVKVGSGLNESPASPSVKSVGANSTIPKLSAISHSRSLRVSQQESQIAVTSKSSDIGQRLAEASTGVFSVSNDLAAEVGSGSLSGSGVGASENNDVALPVASIKSDTTTGDPHYEESKPRPEETDLADQPATKRIRLGQPSARTEQSAIATSSSETNAQFALSAESTKSEPPDVIEIKEESLSENESQLPDYSGYGDYSAAMYASSSAELTQGFGETSMFQASSSFFVPQPGESDQTPELLRRNVLHCQRRRTQSTRARGSYQCRMCSKSFTWTAARLQHENSFHGRRPHPFLCLFCSKGYWNQRDLRGHMASKHSMKKDFPCLKCNKEYSYKHHLKEHMNSVHGGATSVMN